MFRKFYRLFVSTGNVDTKSAEGFEPEYSTKNIKSGLGPMNLEQQVSKQNSLIEKSSDEILVSLNL